ncbi:hypothetical protein GTV32_03855 [Gordonia sp. SID5947]|uniref:IniB N-terminal domain-containing protein n=1 Tax=Gordonia sp. SID5947 TaxID=2690315 RepID=UPI00136C89BE|nr:IniB N-terminal domain-containing protein [Gordonia sp. SID5947]MYR05500.1 hypothetical protein [Gordonia sp. SID5947]
MPQRDTIDEERNALVQFILGLFGDQAKAEAFNENSGKCLADAGLKDVTPQEVRQAVHEVAQTVPAPNGGGGGHWEPQIPSHGSAAGIIQNITNNYYQQFNTIIGDNNHLDARQTNATGDGSVAIGGDNHGDVATTGGTAGENNKTHNTEDNDTTDVDKSVHGDGSGNTSAAEVLDNSHNDSHDSVDVKSAAGGGQGGTSAGTTPAGPATTAPTVAASASGPFHPAAIALDPMPATLAVAAGGDLEGLQHIEPFSRVPQTLVGDAEPTTDAARPVTMTSEDLTSHHDTVPDSTVGIDEPIDPATSIMPDDPLADPATDHVGYGEAFDVGSGAGGATDTSFLPDPAHDVPDYDSAGTTYVSDPGISVAPTMSDAVIADGVADGA